LEFSRSVAAIFAAAPPTLAAVFSLASRRKKRFLPLLAATTPSRFAAAVSNSLLQTFLIQ
jgi:hypothetical protein